MNLDEEIAKARERLHRQIGQWHRRNTLRRRQHVALHLMEVDFAFDMIRSVRESAQ